MPNEPDTSGYHELCVRNRNTGKLLDGICTSGRRGGTAGLNVGVRNNTDINDALGVTLCIISEDTGPELRQQELEQPRSIPVLVYTPDRTDDYWDTVGNYAKDHNGDTAPRLFGAVTAEHIDHLLTSQKAALGDAPDEERVRQVDIPFFVYVTDAGTLEELFERRVRGEVQGFILRGTALVEPAMAAWKRHLSKQQHPTLCPRPFIGVEGSTQDLLQLMESTEEHNLNVDTLIFTDSPGPDEADHTHALHLQRMNMQKTAKRLENPFARPGQKKVRIAIINVQGGAREDAAALLRACEGIEFLDIEVFLVENAEQLASVDPHAIILGGGWHAKQHKLQEDLGINKVIKSLVGENKCHMCALCAGSIQARESDNLMDEVRSKGCDPRATLGVGGYKVDNNILSNPYDVHVAKHAGGPEDPASAILYQVPFSNAPRFVGVDLKKMDVVARLVHDRRASDIDEDDDGDIVGVQVKQREGYPDPVQMMFAFHDEYAFTLFLSEIQMYQQRLQAKRDEIKLRLQCRVNEENHIRRRNGEVPKTDDTETSAPAESTLDDQAIIEAELLEKPPDDGK